MAQLNKEQEKAVYQMNNAVVAAGAGSGKTFVLAQRYAHLVLEKGFTVDQILTLTFTNKAAAEMYQRIYKTLYKISQEEPDNERACRAVKNFSEARIQTLDSYCSSILKNASRYYGIRPDFSVDDEECANQAYKLALPFLLNNRKNKAIIELINNSYSIEKIAQELFANTIIYHSNIANPIDFSSLLEKQIQVTKDEWQITSKAIDSIVEEIIYNIENFEGKHTSFSQALNEIIQENTFNSAPEFYSLLDFFKSSDDIAPINLELKNYLDKIILLFNPRLPGNTKNETIIVIKEKIKELRNKYSKLCSIASFIANYKIMKR